jgi:hypothetical protein
MSVDRVQTWRLGIDPSDASCPQTPFYLSNQPAAGQAASITVPAVPGKTAYITGLEFSLTNPAALASAFLIITGLYGGVNFGTFVAVTTGGLNLLVRDYSGQPLVAAGKNASIAVFAQAGIALVSQSLNVWGFYQ